MTEVGKGTLQVYRDRIVHTDPYAGRLKFSKYVVATWHLDHIQVPHMLVASQDRRPNNRGQISEQFVIEAGRTVSRCPAQWRPGRQSWRLGSD